MTTKASEGPPPESKARESNVCGESEKLQLGRRQAQRADQRTHEEHKTPDSPRPRGTQTGEWREEVRERLEGWGLIEQIPNKLLFGDPTCPL